MTKILYGTPFFEKTMRAYTDKVLSERVRLSEVKQFSETEARRILDLFHKSFPSVKTYSVDSISAAYEEKNNARKRT